MRLIDADALLKALVRKEPFSDCARVVIAECMQEVRHAPTIEPERKKGKWCDTRIAFGGTTVGECSVCKKCAPTGRFCKWCGCEMERGGQDG